MKKRVTKFTVETERTFIFRSRGGPRTRWCAECGAEVEMMTASEAAREIRTSESTIYQLVEARALHFTETADGRVIVCLNSLLK